jgi:hypothetical protein
MSQLLQQQEGMDMGFRKRWTRISATSGYEAWDDRRKLWCTAVMGAEAAATVTEL